MDITFIDGITGKAVKTVSFESHSEKKDPDSGILISRYEEEGCKNRAEYLDMLREDYGAEIVDALLTVLPPSEDFDGLITELKDQANYY
tara:strand:- start:1663 stop:1929 length:267 start_codon:yes stop_codon:yes gene_type:complete